MKIVVCIPTGRKRYLEVLLPYIIRAYHDSEIDEVHFWMNTKNEEDIKYVEDFAFNGPGLGFCKIIRDMDAEAHWDYGRATTVSYFYKNCQDPDTIYFKVDDDVVFIERGTFAHLSWFIQDHPQYLLTYPMIINTVGTSYFLQQEGVINTNPPIGGWTPDMEYPECYRAGFHPLDKVAWQNLDFVAKLHLAFLANQDIFKIQDRELDQYEYVSINFIGWLGSNFAKFNGEVTPGQDENELNYTIPKKLDMYNYILGSHRVAHFAFYNQWRYLEQLGILDRYKTLSGV